jgi:hypothetical protein
VALSFIPTRSPLLTSDGAPPALKVCVWLPDIQGWQPVAALGLPLGRAVEDFKTEGVVFFPCWVALAIALWAWRKIVLRGRLGSLRAPLEIIDYPESERVWDPGRCCDLEFPGWFSHHRVGDHYYDVQWGWADRVAALPAAAVTAPRLSPTEPQTLMARRVELIIASEQAAKKAQMKPARNGPELVKRALNAARDRKDDVAEAALTISPEDGTTHALLARAVRLKQAAPERPTDDIVKDARRARSK